MSIVGDHLRDDCMYDRYADSDTIKYYITENIKLKDRIQFLEKQIRMYRQKESDRSWSDNTQMGRY
jgi:hypothetical protein